MQAIEDLKCFCKMDNIKTGGTYEMSVILDSENNEDKTKDVEF